MPASPFPPAERGPRLAAALIALLLLAAGCDSGLVSENEQKARPVRVTLRYEVEATYASCTVARINALRQPEQSVVTAFPWEETLTVEVSETTSFVASIVATCADASKEGKSTVFIHAADSVVARGSNAGFGASAQATFKVTPDAR